ncbi:uncharacterized protein VTP21DRAFT_3876 [Calcarisporiella thermophila]|uniref:uncharacterized protein n=1 Tax=Calcarisporiella thermophila TaxID=911321 RepID=UPI003743A366
MLVRIRSREGALRLEVNPTDDFIILKDKIMDALKLTDASRVIISNQPSGGNATTLASCVGRTIQDLGIKHGDLLFITIPADDNTAIDSSKSENATTEPSATPIPSVKQDAVDDFLEKQDGLIKRGRDPKFCKHADNGMCDYCMPLEPYDQHYLDQNKIKHLSFHAYLRQLNAQQKKKQSSTALPPLEEPDFRVKIPCSSGHPSWPVAICTKCQPSAITLQRQPFRMVDHVEFSNARLIDNFIHHWRITGLQRFGYLYGRLEPYNEVPLGIKAVVEAIYEPPQENASDGIELALPWEEESAIDEVARECGLVRVGMIYTDLLDDGTGQGTVVCKRHVGSYFLSSLECTFSAQMQLRHPNPTRFSATGKFGSKFVTCVISGNEQSQISVSAYQVSVTCMGMVNADIIQASMEPGLMLVRESTNQRYVPEVFYKFKNEYNATVQKSAKPAFPVDYLLVTVTHGFPHDESPLFGSTSAFPIENRGGIETQDLTAIRKHLGSDIIAGTAPKSTIANAISDFHLLTYIRETSMFDPNDYKQLCRAATLRTDVEVTKLIETSGWQTLITVLRESAGQTQHHDASGPSTSLPSRPQVSATIACRHCTFVNPQSNSSCEMCGLPLDQ